ncbi:MAG: hypothetical protein RJB65_1175 [Actinomycetota bacterium]
MRTSTSRPSSNGRIDTARRGSGTRRLLAVAAITASLLVGCSGSRAGTIAAGNLPDVLRDKDATSEELFALYSDALVQKDTELLGSVLGDQFLLQRTNGTWTDKAGFLAQLPDLRSFTAGPVEERRGEQTIVARLDATGDLVVNGVKYRMTAAPMLLVFEWTAGHWVLQAQGNFNLPGS